MQPGGVSANDTRAHPATRRRSAWRRLSERYPNRCYTREVMTNQELVKRAQSVLFQNYRTQPIALVRGEGTWVWDADGKKYLDFIGGIATVSVGHANPRVREALMAQARLLWHASNLYVTEPQIRLAEKLTAQTKTLKRAFFCNSGTEANEAMIKLARHYQVVNGHPD